MTDTPWIVWHCLCICVHLEVHSPRGMLVVGCAGRVTDLDLLLKLDTSSEARVKERCNDFHMQGRPRLTNNTDNIVVCAVCHVVMIDLEDNNI